MPEWSEQDYDDLRLLEWVASHHRDLMTAEAWENLATLERRRRLRQKAEEAAFIRKWGSALSATKIAALERKLQNGDHLTPEEEQQWAAALLMARRMINRKQIRRWTDTPLADLVFAPALHSTVRSRSTRRPCRGHQRGRRARRVRAPARPTDDPHEIDARRP
jgi:hypothetical protein